MVFKNNKRPYSEDEPCHISYKRQLDYTSFEGFGPCNNSPEKPHTSVDEGGRNFNRFQDEGRLVSHTHTIAELFVASHKDLDNCPFGSSSGLSWFTSSTSEEVSRSEPILQISCSPRFRDRDGPSRTTMESEVMFSSIIDYPPRKLAAIGPDHQADVPVWGPEFAKTSSGNLGTPAQGKGGLGPGLSVPSSQFILSNKWEQLMGTCVIPMSEVDSSGCNGEKVGHGRDDCSCPDEGSVRCVRQHVKEAREKLSAALGQERFVELGFCEMGEDVAQKWSQEEERVFNEVVFSNPASLGRNFWDNLSVVFPTRTKKELVSYYFNVFMLRRRAEQNRLDPLNIDSDNDEWQASDDGDEFANTEEDEDDSVVETPADQDNIVYNEDAHEDVYHEDDDEDDDGDDGGDDGGNGGATGNVAVVEDDVGGLNDFPELQAFFSKPSSHKSMDCHSSVPTDHLASDGLQNGSAEQDVQDDSCTSYECLHGGAVSSGPSDAAATQKQEVGTDHMILNNECGNASLGAMVDHGYVLEACDAKVWDFGFFTSSKSHVDFLPTCSMIEEVFRNEMWNDNEVRDDPPIS
ncbi:hypothetical protein AAC387_Pa03g3229 [Persea americana]